MKDLSIIIVSWRTKDLLFECLTSVYENTQKIDFEILVVDNDSGDGTVEMVSQNFPEVRLIASKINLGFAKANNLAIKQSVGQYILLLNPDTKIMASALDNSVEFMKTQPEIGVLGCQLLNKDMSIQPSVRSFPTFFDHLIMMFKLHHFFPLKKYLLTDFDYHRPAEVDQVMGAYFLISRDCWQKTGQLDEQYYIWFEEVDYCRMVKKNNFKVIYWPGAKIIHYGGQSFKQVYNFKNQQIFNKSRLRYLKKHDNFLAYLLILCLSPISLFLSFLASFKYGK